MMEDIVSRLKAFIENEPRSCSMDYGCITPEYVYRMWGGAVGVGAAELTWWLSDKMFGMGSNLAVGSSGNTVDVVYNF